TSPPRSAAAGSRPNTDFLRLRECSRECPPRRRSPVRRLFGARRTEGVDNVKTLPTSFSCAARTSWPAAHLGNHFPSQRWVLPFSRSTSSWADLGVPHFSPFWCIFWQCSAPCPSIGAASALLSPNRNHDLMVFRKSFSEGRRMRADGRSGLEALFG